MFLTYSAVERLSEGRYAAQLTDVYNIGPVPCGGYTLATMANAAVDALPHPDLLHATCTYLAPLSAGPVELRVEIVRARRSMSWAEVKILQGGEERARAMITAGDLSAMKGPSYSASSPPVLPPLEDCWRLSIDRGPIVPRLMEQIAISFPKPMQFAKGGDEALYTAWMSFDGGEDITVSALPLFADALPPTSFRAVGISGWVPTLELSVQVRARPVRGPLKVRMTTRHISNGHMEEDGEFWDADDNLVVVSRQRALVRS